MEKYIQSKNKIIFKREKIKKDKIKQLNFKNDERNKLMKKVYNNFFIINNQIKQIHNKGFFFSKIIIIITYLIIPIISKNSLINKRLLEEGEVSEIKLIINVTEDGEQEIMHSGFGFEPAYIFANETSMNLTQNYKIL